MGMKEAMEDPKVNENGESFHRDLAEFMNVRGPMALPWPKGDDRNRAVAMMMATAMMKQGAMLYVNAGGGHKDWAELAKAAAMFEQLRKSGVPNEVANTIMRAMLVKEIAEGALDE